jgi:hypothetical protein
MVEEVRELLLKRTAAHVTKKEVQINTFTDATVQ